MRLELSGLGLKIENRKFWLTESSSQELTAWAESDSVSSGAEKFSAQTLPPPGGEEQELASGPGLIFFFLPCLKIQSRSPGPGRLSPSEVSHLSTDPGSRLEPLAHKPVSRG